MTTPAKIGDLITRDLSRKIEEIIKVDQVDEQSVYTEITEYVVTSRLREHYRTLLKAIAEYSSDPHEVLAGLAELLDDGPEILDLVSAPSDVRADLVNDEHDRLARPAPPDQVEGLLD